MALLKKFLLAKYIISRIKRPIKGGAEKKLLKLYFKQSRFFFSVIKSKQPLVPVDLAQ